MNGNRESFIAESYLDIAMMRLFRECKAAETLWRQGDFEALHAMLHSVLLRANACLQRTERVMSGD